ncbi:hypothetical protein R3P38DRAFT_2906729 [Favolaschia claudopus]|uniref:Uncharacterized protein n=1 Tax=Favolaschia claudopus TaxID=2862362 RepID=A0AAW0CIW2_9AGAR
MEFILTPEHIVEDPPLSFVRTNGLESDDQSGEPVASSAIASETAGLYAPKTLVDLGWNMKENGIETPPTLSPISISDASRVHVVSIGAVHLQPSSSKPGSSAEFHPIPVELDYQEEEESEEDERLSKLAQWPSPSSPDHGSTTTTSHQSSVIPEKRNSPDLPSENEVKSWKKRRIQGAIFNVPSTSHRARYTFPFGVPLPAMLQDGDVYEFEVPDFDAVDDEVEETPPPPPRPRVAKPKAAKPQLTAVPKFTAYPITSSHSALPTSTNSQPPTEPQAAAQMSQFSVNMTPETNWFPYFYVPPDQQRMYSGQQSLDLTGRVVSAPLPVAPVAPTSIYHQWTSSANSATTVQGWRPSTGPPAKKAKGKTQPKQNPPQPIPIPILPPTEEQGYYRDHTSADKTVATPTGGYYRERSKVDKQPRKKTFIASSSHVPTPIAPIAVPQIQLAANARSHSHAQSSSKSPRRPLTAFGVPIPPFLFETTSAPQEYRIPDFLHFIAAYEHRGARHTRTRINDAFGVRLPEMLIGYQGNEMVEEFVLPAEVLEVGGDSEEEKEEED